MNSLTLVMGALLLALSLPLTAGELPRLSSPEGTPIELTDDCTVILIDSGGEHRRSCADPIREKLSTANLVWVEQGRLISASQLDGYRLQRPVHITMVPYGEIGLPALPEGHVWKVSSIFRNGSDADSIFDRETIGSAAATIRFPAGPAWAVVLDPARRLSRIVAPFAVTPGRTVSLDDPLQRPQTAVLASLAIPRSASPAGTTLALTGGDQELAPSFSSASGGRLLAIWDDLPPGSVQLEARSSSVHIEPLDVTVRRGHVTLIEGDLIPLPVATVEIVAPHEFRFENGSVLQIIEQGKNEGVRRREITEAGLFRFDALPPRKYHAVLKTGAWEFRKEIDLTRGDQSGEIRLEPIDLSGRITKGGRPVPARVRLTRRGTDLTVTADDEGRYSLRLWEKGKYGLYVYEAGSTAPFSDLLDVDRSTDHDVRLPAARLTVRVQDERTSRPIAGASVGGSNRWVDEKSARRSVTTGGRSDVDGTVILSTLRGGELELFAEAEGYERRGPVRQVIQDDQERAIVIALTPLGSGRDIRVRLADGSPASSAEALIVDDGGAVKFHGVASGEGVIDLPASVERGLLLVRHQAAGGVAVRLEQRPEIVALPMPAEPLVVRVQRVDRSSGSFAPIGLLIDGVRLTGSALNFLAWSRADGANSEGIWTGTNLPAKPLTIIAAPRGQVLQLQAGAFDALGITIAPPWTSGVTVRTSQ